MNRPRHHINPRRRGVYRLIDAIVTAYYADDDNELAEAIELAADVTGYDARSARRAAYRRQEAKT